MIEPMIARLAGCIVFASLLAALVMEVDSPPRPAGSAVVAAAEFQQRVQNTLFTRP